jgi:hypothetical protein
VVVPRGGLVKLLGEVFWGRLVKLLVQNDGLVVFVHFHWAVRRDTQQQHRRAQPRAHSTA